MNSFTANAYVCLCLCVCVFNVRAHDYNFEEEIDLLFFEYSIRRRFSRKRDKKYAKEKKEKK